MQNNRLYTCHIANTSVLTKALVPETEAPGLEPKTEAKAVASKTEANFEAVDPETEAKAARQLIGIGHIASQYIVK